WGVAGVGWSQQQVRCGLGAPAGAAFAVEVAGENGHYIDQPGGERAKFLGTEANAAIDYRAGGCGDFPRQDANNVGSYTAKCRDFFRRKCHRQLPHLLKAIELAVEM